MTTVLLYHLTPSPWVPSSSGQRRGTNRHPSSSRDAHKLTTAFSLSAAFSLAPYERRVVELLRNGKDKRARKLAKKKVRSPPIAGNTTGNPTQNARFHRRVI